MASQTDEEQIFPDTSFVAINYFCTAHCEQAFPRPYVVSVDEKRMYYENMQFIPSQNTFSTVSALLANS